MVEEIQASNFVLIGNRKSCPSAKFGKFPRPVWVFSANSVALRMHFEKSGTRLRAKFEQISIASSLGNSHRHFLTSGLSTRLSQPRALGWEVLSGLMSGNDYAGFPKIGRGNFTASNDLHAARNRPLPQCIRRCFFRKFCCMHFEKSETDEYKAFTA